MVFTPSAHAGKVVIFSRTTGQPFDRYPVDAREMLATGEYTADPSPIAASVPGSGQRPDALPDDIDTRSKAELVAYATEAFGLALDPSKNKASLLDAIRAAIAAPPAPPAE